LSFRVQLVGGDHAPVEVQQQDAIVVSAVVYEYVHQFNQARVHAWRPPARRVQRARGFGEADRVVVMLFQLPVDDLGEFARLRRELRLHVLLKSTADL
jgi:hypothetical protein